MAIDTPVHEGAAHDTALHRSTDRSRFTDELWRHTTDLRRGIDELEFLRRLGDGSLPLDVFRFYVEQDFLYLTGYARALALVAAAAPDPHASAFWATSAATATEVEATLHRELLDTLPPSGAPATESPACLGYVSFLVATAATRSYAVGAAAVLPCFWIYADVGRRLAAEAREVLGADPTHPYARWVTTYDDPEFHESVERARLLVDEAAAAASPAERSAMLDAFVVASRYESMFFDSALHQQSWPA
ncbi:TenA family protein [Rhodococcus sp. HNM0569]|uniref:TenA family protein n=1 Tax=Rhodococcus sp. HNM0569 TaxID=2716340 RepID=UPI00197ECA65|nr:TenA family protein [Rhodococcus sp. HNM0569]